MICQVQGYIMMKNLVTVLLGVVVIAVGAFFVLKEKKPEAAVSEGTAGTMEKKPFQKVEQKVEADADQPYSPEGGQRGASRASNSEEKTEGEASEEEQREERMSQYREERKQRMKGRLDQRFKLKLSTMVRELGLNEQQEAAVQAFYDEQVVTLTDANPREVFNNPDLIPQLASALRGDQLASELSGVLSADQISGLKEINQREAQNAAESSALTSLADLQRNLSLSEDQKDAVFAVLSEQATIRKESQSDGDYLMRNYMHGSGMGSSMGDFDLGDVMGVAAASKEDGADREQIVSEMQTKHNQEIEAKVGAMAEILDPAQLGAYQNSLEQQANMMSRMASGMSRMGGGRRGGGGGRPR